MTKDERQLLDKFVLGFKKELKKQWQKSLKDDEYTIDYTQGIMHSDYALDKYYEKFLNKKEREKDE